MMAMELFRGDIVKELLKLLGDVSIKTYKCNSIAKDLSVTIANIQPNICREIQCTGDEVSSHHDVQMRRFFETLEKGKKLTEEILKSNPWNLIRQLYYVGKMENLHKDINEFLRGALLTGISANVNHLQETFEVRFNEIAMKLDELSRQLAATNIKRNERVGEAMKATEMFTDTELGNLGLGLELGKKKVKNVLLKSKGEGGLIGISGMCNSGKSTLVKELLGDDEVQDHFQVLLVTVSQSPDLKDLRVRIWEFLTGYKFGCGPCLPKPIVQSGDGVQKWKLVILDDVWTMESLDQLMLKIPGSTTLVVLRSKLADPGNTYNVEETTADTKESLLDLGAFPENEEGTAFTTLIDLSEKNLITLVKEPSVLHPGYDDKFVTHHDDLKDLAPPLSNTEKVNEREHVLPRERERNKDEPYNAQIVSNHTVSNMKEFVTLLDEVSKKAYWCKGIAENLGMFIADIQPTINEIQYSGVELSQHRHAQMRMFFETLEKGKKLTEKILKCNRWNMIRQVYHVRKMEDVQKKINVFLRASILTSILADVHHLRVTSEVGFDRVDRSFGRLSEQLCSMKIMGGEMVGEAMKTAEMVTNDELGNLSGSLTPVQTP